MLAGLKAAKTPVCFPISRNPVYGPPSNVLFRYPAVDVLVHLHHYMLFTLCSEGAQVVLPIQNGRPGYFLPPSWVQGGREPDMWGMTGSSSSGCTAPATWEVVCDSQAWLDGIATTQLDIPILNLSPNPSLAPKSSHNPLSAPHYGHF